MPVLNISEEAKSHLAAHGDIEDLILEAWESTDVTEGVDFVDSIQMARIVGLDACVGNSSSELFAFRDDRNTPVRVVIGDGAPSSLVTIIAEAMKDGSFDLHTGYVGQLAPRHPTDPYFVGCPSELGESFDFWNRHALTIPEGTPTFPSNWFEVMSHKTPKIVNLTPHPLSIQRIDGSIQKIPKGDSIARLEEGDTVAGQIGWFSTARVNFGGVVGLPAPVKGVIYITSALVRSAVPMRPDVFSPGAPERDENGKPLFARGVLGLASN